MSYVLLDPIVDRKEFIQSVRKDAYAMHALDDVVDPNASSCILSAIGMLLPNILEEVKELKRGPKLSSADIRDFLLAPANPTVARLSGSRPGYDQLSILHRWQSEAKTANLRLNPGYKALFSLGVPAVFAGVSALGAFTFLASGHGTASAGSAAIFVLSKNLFKDKLKEIQQSALTNAPAPRDLLPSFQYQSDLYANPQFSSATQRVISANLSMLQPLELTLLQELGNSTLTEFLAGNSEDQSHILHTHQFSKETWLSAFKHHLPQLFEQLPEISPDTIIRNLRAGRQKERILKQAFPVKPLTL